MTTRAAVESALESPHAEQFADVVDADSAVVYIHDGDIPPGGIHDWKANLIIADDQGVNIGVIESDEPVIIDQLEATFGEYRAVSTRLTPSMLEEGPDSNTAES